LLESVLTVMQQGDARKDLVKVHDLFADNYASQGKFQLAYEHASTRSDLMSTLASEERARRTAHLRVQFDSERAESVNRELSEENRLKAQMLDKEQDFNRLTLIGVLVLLLIAVALSYSIWRQKQLEKSLVLLANTDDLTGLVNRRRLFEIGNHEMHRAVRYGHEMTVLVLDLDYFKKINDQYGHAVGDLVLRRVAAHIAGGLREEDWLGRFGGEEFIAILPHTDRPHATEVAERIRVDVANLDYKACSVESRLTVSIGVSWLHGRGDSFQMMVNRADAALYNAKAAGRNRVLLQEESGEAEKTT
jgi:diguanylate cyclase (GGDEF)-like protein